MKVILKNTLKNTAEFLECGHIKLDKERLIFIGNRVISILLSEETDKEHIIKQIEESFLKNANIEVTISDKNISISRKEE